MRKSIGVKSGNLGGHYIGIPRLINDQKDVHPDKKSLHYVSAVGHRLVERSGRLISEDQFVIVSSSSSSSSYSFSSKLQQESYCFALFWVSVVRLRRTCHTVVFGVQNSLNGTPPTFSPTTHTRAPATVEWFQHARTKHELMVYIGESSHILSKLSLHCNKRFGFTKR
jgi:hypothetical protein